MFQREAVDGGSSSPIKWPQRFARPRIIRDLDAGCLIGELQANLLPERTCDFDIRRVDPVGCKAASISLTSTTGNDAADFHDERRLRGELARDVRNRDRAAPEVESNLPVARAGAG